MDPRVVDCLAPYLIPALNEVVAEYGGFAGVNSQTLQKVPVPTRFLRAFPDGRLLSVHSCYGQSDLLLMWDLSSAEPSRVLEKEVHVVGRIIVLSNGTLALLNHKTILCHLEFWDIKNLSAPKLIHSSDQSDDSTRSLLELRGKSRLAAGTNSGRINVYDLETFTETLVLTNARKDAVNDMAELGDNNLAVLYENNRVQVWNLNRCEFVWTSEFECGALAVLDHGRYGRYERFDLVVTKVSTSAIVVFEGGPQNGFITLDTQGCFFTWFEVLLNGKLVSVSRAGIIRVWDNYAQQIKTPSAISGCVVLPNGSVATAHYDNVIRIWT